MTQQQSLMLDRMTRLLVVGIDAIGRETTRVYKRWPIALASTYSRQDTAQNTVEELGGLSAKFGI